MQGGGWDIRLQARACIVVAGAVLLVGAALAWGLVIRPEPFSDWLYYWKAAEGSIAYERGGVLLYVLRALQALSLPPYVAALALNVASALAVLAVAYHAAERRIELTLALVFAYLLAITPYYAVVQFDLASTALLSLGIWLLATEPAKVPKGLLAGAATILIAFAVSSRPQFLLVLLVFSTLLTIAATIARGARPFLLERGVRSALILTIGALLGFAVDSALRADAGRSEAVRTNSGVTLYAGLLSSGTSAPACGHWSPQATLDAREDAHLPLPEAVSGRLKAHPAGHWFAVVRCKARMVLLPGAYALSWSLEAPDLERDPYLPAQERLKAAAPNLTALEGRGYRVLLLIIYALTAVAVVKNARGGRWLQGTLPLMWLASFWLVHAVFEIQARYFLPLFLVLPLMLSPAVAGLVKRTASPDDEGAGSP